METISYDTGICKVRVSGMARRDDSWKQGNVVIFKDGKSGSWKIRVDQNVSKVPLVSPMKLINRVQSVSVNGSRFNVRLAYNSICIYADKSDSCDSEYLDKIKTLKNILLKLKEEKDPSDILGLKRSSLALTPSRANDIRYDARDVAQLISSDSTDDSVFNEPRDTLRAMGMKSPLAVRKLQASHSRAAKMLNRSLDEIQRRKDQENKENSRTATIPLRGSMSEQENAQNFYGSSSSTLKRSSLLDSIQTLSAHNVRVTPSKSFSDYSIKRPGLLPSPTSGRITTSPAVAKPTSNILSSPPRLQGFSNIGNTCYMNAILQSLLGLTSFHWDLIYNATGYRSLPAEGLYIPLLKLCKIKAKGTKDQEMLRNALKTVKNAISSSAKRFSGYEQHDAHEFLAQLLDQLSEEIQAVEKDPTNSHRWINPTVANFETEVHHTITCLGCGSTVSKTEQIYDMSVEMPEANGDLPGSIQSALETFLKPEKLEYKCEECCHGESEVSHLLTKLPRILVIHLKRYSYDSAFQVHSKVGKPVFIPNLVTLRAYCDEDTMPARPPENPELLKVLRRAASGSSEDEAVVPQGRKDKPSSRPGISDTMDGSEIADIFLPPVKNDDNEDLERVLELSRHEFESKDRVVLKSNAIIENVDLDRMNEDEQLRLALELSMSECQPMAETSLPEADDWMEDSPSKSSSSIGSDMEKSMLPNVLESVSQNKTSTGLSNSTPRGLSNSTPRGLSNSTPRGLSNSTPQKSLQSFDWTSPLGTKRRRHALTPSMKSRKTDDGKNNAVVLETSDSDSTLVNQRNDLVSDRQVNTEDRFSSKNSIGLKGGGPFGKEESEKCHSCGRTETECCCVGFDSDVTSVTNFRTSFRNSAKRILDNVFVEKDCVCDVYRGQTNSWCRACHGKTKKVETRDSIYDRSASKRTTSISPNTLSSAAMDRINAVSNSRLFERKFAPKDSIDWVLKTTERLDHEKEGREMDSDGDLLDYFIRDIEAAKRASLVEKELAGMSDEQLMQRAMEASLEVQEDNHEKDYFERAVRASLEEDEHFKLASAVSLKSEKGLNVSSADDELSDVGEMKAKSKANASAEKGVQPHSFVLVSVVSHVGAAASFGHYVADVYDAKKGDWLSYDDSNVTPTTARDVRESRRSNGYVFFYMAREVLKEIHSQLNHPLLKEWHEPKARKLTERSPNVLRKRSPNQKREFSFVSTLS